MTTKKKSNASKFSWPEIISAATSVTALVISLLALYQSAVSQRISEEGNNIARTAQASDRTQVARGLRANIQYWLFVAKSPDLRAEADKDWYQTSDLKPQLITTPYQLEALNHYDAEFNKGYIFLIFVNYGPDDVEQLQFKNFRWEPSLGSKKPAGVDIGGNWGPLLRGYFYAALVDILGPIDKQKPWNRANFDLASTNYSIRCLL